MAVGMMGAAMVNQTRPFMLMSAILSVGNCLFKGSISAVLNMVAREQGGAVSGAIDATEAVCRVVSPILGGLLLDRCGTEAPTAGGGLMCLIGTLVMTLVTTERAVVHMKQQ